MLQTGIWGSKLNVFDNKGNDWAACSKWNVKLIFSLQKLIRALKTVRELKGNAENQNFIFKTLDVMSQLEINSENNPLLSTLSLNSLPPNRTKEKTVACF